MRFWVACCVSVLLLVAACAPAPSSEQDVGQIFPQRPAEGEPRDALPEASQVVGDEGGSIGESGPAGTEQEGSAAGTETKDAVDSNAAETATSGAAEAALDTTTPLDIGTFGPWQMTFGASAQSQVDVMDDKADVTFGTSGAFSFELKEGNQVEGGGEGFVNIHVEGGLGAIPCEGEKTVRVTFKVKGTYDPDTNKADMEFYDLSPENTVVKSVCTYAGAPLDFTVDVPLIFIDKKATFDLFPGSPNPQQIVHPVPSWDTDIVADWTFTVDGVGFDFDLDVDPVNAKIKQGQSAIAIISVKPLRGVPSPVKLTVTEWQDVTAKIGISPLGAGGQTTLTVTTTCNTPADTYVHTVTGESLLHSSVDAFTVNVEADPNCT